MVILNALFSLTATSSCPSAFSELLSCKDSTSILSVHSIRTFQSKSSALISFLCALCSSFSLSVACRPYYSLACKLHCLMNLVCVPLAFNACHHRALMNPHSCSAKGNHFLTGDESAFATGTCFIVHSENAQFHSCSVQSSLWFYCLLYVHLIVCWFWFVRITLKIGFRQYIWIRTGVTLLFVRTVIM